MSRDSRVHLEDILQSIERIESYVQGFDARRFAEDPRTIDAVIRNLEIIGEAAKRVPTQLRDAHPTIEWRRWTGFRDILAHAYHRVDLTIVWQVSAERLPEFREQIRALPGALCD